jgi:hypothetical protein
MLFNGFGVESSLEEGFKWILKTTKFGSQKAQAEAYKLYKAISPHGDNC